MMLEWLLIAFIVICGFVLFPAIILTHHNAKVRRYAIIPMYLFLVICVIVLSMLRMWGFARE